jgi:hypothetical protein
MEAFSLQLHAAQQADTRKQTEEKIGGLKNDFDSWAEDFEKRRPVKQKQLEQARNASLQKQLQLSADSMPLFSYVIKFVQERVTAYCKKTGRQIRIDIPPLPDNFFATDANNIERSIRFSGGKAQWTFSLNANVPPRDENPPQLGVSITNADGHGANVYINRLPRSERFVISGNGVFPSPDVTEMFGQYGLGKFEPTVQEIFGALIESQLAETP